jgi:hypothetical protein
VGVALLEEVFVPLDDGLSVGRLLPDVLAERLVLAGKFGDAAVLAGDGGVVLASRDDR